jgi:hypothetical protein
MGIHYRMKGNLTGDKDNANAGNCRIFLPVRLAFYMLLGGLASAGIILSSCERFVDPEQELIRESEDMFADWSEYRSAEMGLYALQQNLVEQILVLGELRGDLLQITQNATPELADVYNFSIGKDNPYASPVNFYKLITACNRLARQLESAHPEVLDKNQPVTNYDRLYGEVLCMRAWAYFNAVRIYGKVPYVHESLNSVEEIESYVNSGAEFVDSVYINFVPDGYYNDTIRDTTIVLERKFLDLKTVIDTFTCQLEDRIKAVGVNHAIYNKDLTWHVTIWNNDARYVLLGQMYLFEGDYSRAMANFNRILYNYTSETSDIRYGLDDKFAYEKWKNIFTGVEPYEHIYTLWFGKSYQQTNEIQPMFSVLPPNQYMMKPTASCIGYWESIWNDPILELDYANPERSEVIDPGLPGDFYRGYGVSYKYYKNGEEMLSDTVRSMLLKKLHGNMIDVQLMMNNVDTVVTKYSIGKNQYSHDAHFIIYRAAAVHLYAAEIYVLWNFDHAGVIRTEINTGLQIVNDGSYDPNRPHKQGFTFIGQLGVRGRVGFGDNYDAISAYNIVFIHDPVTNEIVDYIDYTRNFKGKQEYLIDMILEERARELAFEGERFYDLMRIAKRRNDPSFLADRVAAKFSGARKEAIRSKLMDERNWYIDIY